MGDFYQGQRLGYYKKYLETATGRFVYQQVGGDQYMYYLDSEEIWMVGATVGQDLGGILNRGHSQCPEGKISSNHIPSDQILKDFLR